MTLLRHLAVRPVIAALAFALAAAALVWPIHYKAASGAALDGAQNQFTLSSFSTQACPWRFQLGHLPGAVSPPPPVNASATRYLLDSYNDGTCSAKRYDRTSQALLWLLIGFGFTISHLRRRERALWLLGDGERAAGSDAEGDQFPSELR